VIESRTAVSPDREPVRDTDGDGLEDGNDSSPRDPDSNNDGIAEEKYKQLLDAVKAGEYDEIIKKHLASIPPRGKRSKGGSGNG
jgi:hypothetical protein